MRIGASLFLIAVGAILYFAVTAKVSGLELSTVGIILMVIGGIGLLFEVIMYGTRRRDTVVTHQRGVTYVDPLDRP